uniref:Uncharacterized protein n=1 Tax=Cannabis sativa TaxID=3483 RepID=A0A803P7D8_CANSA
MLLNFDRKLERLHVMRGNNKGNGTSGANIGPSTNLAASITYLENQQAIQIEEEEVMVITLEIVVVHQITEENIKVEGEEDQATQNQPANGANNHVTSSSSNATRRWSMVLPNMHFFGAANTNTSPPADPLLVGTISHSQSSLEATPTNNTLEVSEHVDISSTHTDYLDTLDVPNTEHEIQEQEAKEPTPQQLVPTHPTVTRAKAGIFKPKVYLGQAKWNPNLAEPSCIEEALESKEWNDGTLKRFKAKLVRKGFH